MLLLSLFVFFFSLYCCLFVADGLHRIIHVLHLSKTSCIMQPPGLLPLSCLVIRAITFKSLTRFPSCILADGLKAYEKK
ncbi:hypothetical protein BDV36DRAFT_109927 [Aspergillus pseudocaelatus]|uniref:Secreted protein n=1 Tax=Aspergillus pseudocaelatus TaxID=1825620 RepID=A0ABQ6W0U7_9EURO|nr:hypothetical protein BDV36DRAFT_109927 [Aspergillus pseudocaelatus]